MRARVHAALKSTLNPSKDPRAGGQSARRRERKQYNTRDITKFGVVTRDGTTRENTVESGGRGEISVAARRTSLAQLGDFMRRARLIVRYGDSGGRLYY